MKTKTKIAATVLAATCAISTISLLAADETKPKQTFTAQTDVVETDPLAAVSTELETLAHFLNNATTTTTTAPVAAVTRRPLTLAEPTEANFDLLAQCECGGNWGCNTGNGYFGALQMTAQAWAGFGGLDYAPAAHLATREQQIAVGINIQQRMGWGAWPACSRKLGFR